MVNKYHKLPKRNRQLQKRGGKTFVKTSKSRRRNSKKTAQEEVKRTPRFITKIFSSKRIKSFFGANIALAIGIAGFTPNTTTFNFADQNVVTAPAIVTTTEKSTRYPVNEVKITQEYRTFHPALDLDGVTGDPIYPIMDGKVVAIQHSRFAYGNAILVDHGNGLYSLYAHLSKIHVKEGQEVNTNSPIGEMGATGRAFGDHLHLEVYDHGRAINPHLILPKNK